MGFGKLHQNQDKTAAASVRKAPLMLPLPSRIVVFLGCLAILASAVCFYISTVIVRWSEKEVAIDAGYFVFFRFLMGFIMICVILAVQRKRLRPRRYDLLIGRTVFNCVAVFCFYRAVTVTSLAEANILNMTYPIFLAVISWFVLKAQRDRVAVAMVIAAFAGIWLILSPGRISPELGNLWGLCSGITASVAILYLNISRQYHDTETILFYVFGLGGVLIYVLFFRQIFWPDVTAFKYLFWCAAIRGGWSVSDYHRVPVCDRRGGGDSVLHPDSDGCGAGPLDRAGSAAYRVRMDRGPADFYRQCGAGGAEIRKVAGGVLFFHINIAGITAHHAVVHAVGKFFFRSDFDIFERINGTDKFIACSVFYPDIGVFFVFGSHGGPPQ